MSKEEQVMKLFKSRMKGFEIAIMVGLANGDYIGCISDRYFQICYKYKKPKIGKKKKRKPNVKKSLNIN